MKLIDSIDNNKIILLGMLGLMAYNLFPNIKTDEYNFTVDDNTENITDESSNEQQKRINIPYIEKGKRLISANNFAAIKTLYKLQSILDDLALLQKADFSQNIPDNTNIGDVVEEIKPYLSPKKLNTVKTVMNNMDNMKKTVTQINSIKSQISTLPKDTPKNEKLKFLMNELPNVSGVPALDKINEIKNMANIIKPLIQKKENATKTENIDVEKNYEELKTENNEELNDIMEVIKLFENEK